MSLHVCVKGAEERDINRETGRAHRTTAYLIEKKIVCDAPLEPTLDRRRCLSIKTRDMERRVLAVITQINAQQQ